MDVYVDVVFGVNAVIDYLLLQCSAKLGGAPARRLRLVLAAGLGGLFAAGSFLWQPLQQWPMRLVALAGMLLLAFGTGPGIWRQSGLFVLSSLALAGLVLLVAAVFGWGLVILNQGAYYPVSWPALILTAGLGYLAADLFLRRAAQHGGAELVQTVICVQDKRAQITALRDTGNTLLDPMTGLPVLIVYWKAVAQVLPAQLQQDWLSDPTAHFSQLVQASPELRWRMIPYRALGGRGVLLAFASQQVEQDGKAVRGMTVALAPEPISDGGGYAGLLGGKR